MDAPWGLKNTPVKGKLMVTRLQKFASNIPQSSDLFKTEQIRMFLKPAGSWVLVRDIMGV